MKKLVKLTLSIGLLGASLLFTQHTKACKPGEIYVERNKTLGICHGSGSECAGCKKVQLAEVQ